MLDNIGVLVATVIMVLMALTIVTLKVSQDINILNQGSIFKVEKYRSVNLLSSAPFVETVIKSVLELSTADSVITASSL